VRLQDNVLLDEALVDAEARAARASRTEEETLSRLRWLA